MSFPQGTTATLYGEYVDGSGSFTDPVTPLLTILNPLGAAVLSDVEPERDSLGHYHYDYPIAADGSLGTWIARWSGVIGGVLQSGDDEFEVTAAAVDAAEPYVSIDEIRALPNLGDDTRFSDAELAEAREWFETIFEDYTSMAFVPRAATSRFIGASGSELILPHWPVRSITAARTYTTTTAYTDFTTDELDVLMVDGSGVLRRYGVGYWPADVAIDYVHGQAAPPADVKREALVAIQEKLMEGNSGRPVDRTYGVATDGVFVRSILPGKDKPFGIASVDEVANRYRAKYRVPAIGGGGVTVITGPTPTPADSYGGY